MVRYFYPVPNGVIHGASLKIQNTSDGPINQLYADAGVFLVYGDGNEFPLVTLADANFTEIPANGIVWCTHEFVAPFKPYQSCRIAVDSTSLPQACLLTPVIHLGVVANGNVTEMAV